MTFEHGVYDAHRSVEKETAVIRHDAAIETSVFQLNMLSVLACCMGLG